MFVKIADASYNGMYMVTEELLNFVRAQVASGMHPDEIERLLVGEGGWDKGDVDEAMVTLGLMSPTPASVPVVEVVAQVPPQEEITPAVAFEEKVEEKTPDVVIDMPVAQEPVSIAEDKAGEVTFDIPVSDELEQVREEKTDEVLANVPAIEGSTPSPTSGSGTHEDFLGIFGDEQVAPIVEVPPENNVTPERPLSLAPSFNLASAMGAESKPIEENTSVAEAILPPVASPELIAATPSLVVEEQPLSSVSSSPDTTAGVHFDFSSINKNETTPPPQPVILNTSDPALVLGKTIETKSVADAWLAGARDSKATTDALALAPVSEEPKKESKPVVSRTMGSDILLRGTGAVIMGVPSLLPSQEPVAPVLPKEEKPPVAPRTQTPLAEDIMRRNKIKKILLIAIGVLVTLGIAIGGVMFFMTTKGPDKVALFDKVSTGFFSSSAFGYQGDGKLDLVLSTVTASGEQKGVMKFDVAYGGALQNGQAGYGDGSHRLKLAGGLQSGNFIWSTDIETDMKVVGDILYFHVIALPDSANMDPDALRTYWIKVNLSDVARELALQGVAATQEGYGNFGGSTGGSSFSALLQKSLPFTVGDIAAGEESSKSVLHYKLKADPDRMIDLTSLLLRKYMNKDLILTDEKKLRLKDAFAKITGDVWVNSDTGTLMKLSIAADFDDDMFDMHVKGPIAFSFNFSDFNKPVAVETPTPILTLEELQARNDDYKKVKEKRAHDQIKLDRLSSIKDALTLYYDDNKKYPASLAQLEQSGKLATSSVDSIVLKQYLYASYIKDGVFTKAGRCTTKGKACEFYHLGINLDDVTNPVLEGDVDQVDDIVGKDISGCSGESGAACYDIISSNVLPVQASSSTPSSPSATSSVTQ